MRVLRQIKINIIKYNFVFYLFGDIFLFNIQEYILEIIMENINYLLN